MQRSTAQQQRFMIADAYRVASRVLGVSLQDLMGAWGDRAITRARHRTWYLASLVCPHATPAAIGRLAGRDATTVRSGLAAVERRLDEQDLVEAATMARLVQEHAQYDGRIYPLTPTTPFNIQPQDVVHVQAA